MVSMKQKKLVDVFTLRDALKIKSESVRKKFKFPYTIDSSQFKSKLMKRGSSNSSKKARTYLKERWGISFEMLDFEPKGVFLPRQIARPDIESLFTFVIARNLGISPGILSLTLDPWMSSPYKTSFINPVIWDIDAKTINRKILERPKQYQSFDAIFSDSGENIIDFYTKKFSEFFPEVPIVDITPVYSKVMGMNIQYGKERIPKIFVKSGRTVRPYVFSGGKYGPYTLEDIMSLSFENLVRPSSEWNYGEVYLMMPGIIYPELAFAISPWEFDDSKIQGMTLKAYDKINELTGEYPLCVPFPSLSEIGLPQINGRLGKSPEYTVLEGNIDLLIPPSTSIDLWKASFDLIGELVEKLMQSKKNF